ncbi:MAG: serine hydrolase domain-containing protein, partial [Planctomycetota bacterium]
MSSFARALSCLAVFAVLTPTLSRAAPVREGYEASARALSRFIRREVSQKDIPALSISISDSRGTIWSAGFGYERKASKRPATESTVYRVGSISKLFTDIAFLRFVEAGKVGLDDPVQKLLPEFRPKNPLAEKITWRQLLAHHSGIVRESPVGNYFDPREPTIAATVASLNETDLVYPPGRQQKYSNAGITVIGLAVEKLSG